MRSSDLACAVMDQQMRVSYITGTSLGLQTNNGEKWSSQQPQGGVWSWSQTIEGAHRFWTWLCLEILHFLTEQPWFWVIPQPSDPLSTGVGGAVSP